MSDDYKKKFHEALEKQKQGPPPTIEEQHKQMMRMNGWRSIAYADGKRKILWEDDDQFREIIIGEEDEEV